MRSLLRHRRFVIVLALLIIGALFLYSYRRPLLHQLGAYLIVEEPLVVADLLVIISGTLPEIHYGLDLYHQGYAKKVLFLGHFPVELAVISKEPFEVMEKPWDEIAAHMAIQAGVPADALLFSDAFDNSTYDRVVSLVRTAQANDQRSMIIVTSPTHARRVGLSARHILQGAPPAFRLAPTPQRYYPEPYRFHLDNWWLDENHPKMIFDEYTKLAYYWLKYGW